MAYYEQTLLSAIAGGTSTNKDNIIIVNGAIEDLYINKAVTLDGDPVDLASIKVKLAGDGDVVLGSIVGVSYGKLQVVVDGWDIKFISGSSAAVTQNSRIVGAVSASITGVADGTKGYIKSYVIDPATPGSPTDAELSTIPNARGSVLKGTTVAGGIAYVSMRFGG